MRDAWSNVLGESQEMMLNRPAGQVARCMGRHGKEAGGAFQMIGPLLVDGGEDSGWHTGRTNRALTQTVRNVVPVPFSFSPPDGITKAFPDW